MTAWLGDPRWRPWKTGLSSGWRTAVSSHRPLRSLCGGLLSHTMEGTWDGDLPLRTRTKGQSAVFPVVEMLQNCAQERHSVALLGRGGCGQTVCGPSPPNSPADLQSHQGSWSPGLTWVQAGRGSSKAHPSRTTPEASCPRA